MTAENGNRGHIIGVLVGLTIGLPIVLDQADPGLAVCRLRKGIRVQIRHNLAHRQGLLGIVVIAIAADEENASIGVHRFEFLDQLLRGVGGFHLMFNFAACHVLDLLVSGW